MEASKLQTQKNQELSINYDSKREGESLNETAFNPVKGEMALWSAVITQALQDAGSESEKAEAKKEKVKAIRWLLSNSEDFQIVCLNAGWNPVYVRQKAIEAIGRNCVWRRSNTELYQENAPSSPAFLSTKQYYIPKRPAHQPKLFRTRFFEFSPAPYQASLISASNILSVFK